MNTAPERGGSGGVRPSLLEQPVPAERDGRRCHGTLPCVHAPPVNRSPSSAFLLLLVHLNVNSVQLAAAFACQLRSSATGPTTCTWSGCYARTGCGSIAIGAAASAVKYWCRRTTARWCSALTAPSVRPSTRAASPLVKPAPYRSAITCC